MKNRKCNRRSGAEKQSFLVKMAFLGPILCRRILFSLIAIFAFCISTLAADSEESQWKWGEYGIVQTDNPCAIPTSYPEKDWKWSWYADFKKTDFSGWGKNVIFLGDSISYGWNFQKGYPSGDKVLKEYIQKYPGVRPYSIAVSGDEPQNTLWLITEGDILKSFDPKVVVLMIGINSLNAHKTPEQVAGGIKNIILVLRKIKPNSKILLLAILPCWGPANPAREQIKKTNQIASQYADCKDVFFLDFGDKLLASDGSMNPELSYDAIHLTEKGYELWAQTMFPYLDDIVKTGGTSEMWKNQSKAIAQ